MVRWVAAGIAMALPCLVAHPALAAILVTVSWTYVTTEISPLQQTHSSPESSSFLMEGRQVIGPKQAGAAFGQTAAGVNSAGSSFRATYRVSKGRVIETLRFAGSITQIIVSTNGVDSCTASVQFSKPRGMRYFEAERQGTHEHMVMSDEHAEDVSCAISRQ